MTEKNLTPARLARLDMLVNNIKSNLNENDLVYFDLMYARFKFITQAAYFIRKNLVKKLAEFCIEHKEDPIYVKFLCDTTNDYYNIQFFYYGIDLVNLQLVDENMFNMLASNAVLPSKNDEGKRWSIAHAIFNDYIKIKKY